MPLESLMIELNDSLLPFSTIKPPLKPGLTYTVRLTQVRATTETELVVLCAVRAPESDVGSVVHWTLRFPEGTPEDAFQTLDGQQPMKWVIGQNGQIDGVVVSNLKESGEVSETSE